VIKKYIRNGGGGSLASGGTVNGNLVVTGTTTLQSTLAAGATTITGAVAVSGDANLSGHVNVLGATKDLAVTGTVRINNDWVIAAETTKTADYTIVSTDALVFMNAAGATNITLPAAPATARRLRICNVGAGTATVLRNGKAMAPVDADITLTSGQKCDLYYNGTLWFREGTG
jgi:hypothetical protein